jgi:ligand-binding sensor domain-containing protein
MRGARNQVEKWGKVTPWAGLALGVALAGCPRPPGELARAEFSAAAPLPLPEVALVPSVAVRDIAVTSKTVWVSTEGSLLAYDRATGGMTSYGPAQGIEYGEASRLVLSGEDVLIAGNGRVLIAGGKNLRVLQAPATVRAASREKAGGFEGEKPAEEVASRVVSVASDGGRVFAVLAAKQGAGKEHLCEVIAGEEAALYEHQEKGWARVETPGVPRQVVSNPEGLWLATSRGLFVRSQGQQGFREILLGEKNEVGDLWVDPKGRVWAFTKRGLFGGSLQAGVLAIPGGEFFGGARAAVGVAVEGEELWIATPRGLYARQKGGWERHEVPRESGARFTKIARAGQRLYAGTDRGLLVREGSTWVYASPESLAPSGPVRSLAAAPGGLWVGTSSEARVESAAGGMNAAISQEGDDPTLEAKEGSARPKLAGAGESKPGERGPSAALAVPIKVSFPELREPGLFRVEGGASQAVPLDGFRGGVLALDALPDGGLWVAGRKGIRFRRADGGLESFPETESQGARSIVADTRGARWFAATDAPTGRGLGLLVKSPSGWTSFTTRDGLPVNEVNGLVPSGETLWLVQSKGISGLSDKGVSTTKLPGPLYSIVETPGGLWAAGCADLYHQEEKVWANYPKPPGGHAAIMASDAQGRLYVGNEGGLYRLAEGKWSQLPGAGGLAVSALAVLPGAGGQVLWVGAENGALLSYSLTAK